MSEQIRLCLHQRLQPPWLRVRRNDAADQSARIVNQNARWNAARIEHHFSSIHDRHRSTEQARLAQRFAIHDQRVPVNALQRDRLVWKGGIEQGAIRERLTVPVVLVPAPAYGPLARPFCLLLNDPFDRILPAGGTEQIGLKQPVGIPN